MPEYFLADDLSGALDAAAGFHTAGHRVTIALSPAGWSAVPDGSIVGLTTETRNLAPAVAAEKVAQVLASGRARGARLIYKKIDSTLRGPMAAELAALAAALPDAKILLAPANPRVGRTVRDGQLLVHGVPVAETEFARDPVSPVRESSIAKLLGGMEATGRAIIPDVETEADLEEAVRRRQEAGAPWVAVGSGALARVVGRRCLKPAESSQEIHPIRGHGPTLMIGGSAHPANREQAQVLARERNVPLHELRVADPEPATRAAIASLRTRGAAALIVEAARADSAIALAAIATAARTAIETAGVGRVFATGGETAYALCRALGVSALAFLAEIEPGLSLSEGQAAPGSVLFAIKPGGFGDVRTWERAWLAMNPDR